MYCSNLCATINREYCLRRRAIARDCSNANQANVSKQSFELLKHCLKCKQGDKVERDPKRFINKDYHLLVKDEFKKNGKKAVVVKGVGKIGRYRLNRIKYFHRHKLKVKE
jgi:hypothetical protein